MSTGFCKFVFLIFGAVFGGSLFIFWGIFGTNPRACRRRISPAPVTVCRYSLYRPICPHLQKIMGKLYIYA